MTDDDYAVAELVRAEERFRVEGEAEQRGGGSTTALSKRLLEVGDGAMEKLQWLALAWSAGSPAGAALWIGGVVQGALWERERAATATVPATEQELRAEASEARTGQEDDALAVLRDLVALKDGPRGEYYRKAKDSAWERARRVVEERPTRPTSEEAIDAFVSTVIRSWPWTGLKDLEADGRLERLKMGARIDG